MNRPPIPGWHDEGRDAAFSDPAACNARATAFERKIRRRNFIEYAAGVLVTVLFGGSALGAIAKGEVLITAGLLTIIVGVWVALWNLRQRGSNLERRPEEPCLDHLKRQYRRQYEALRAVPLWYIGPMVPGVALFYFGVAEGVARTLGWSEALSGLAKPVAISFGIFAAIALANVVAARMIRRKIAELDTLA